MELETLLKEREAYGQRILQLGIQIAVIFIVPVAMAVGAHYLWAIPLVYVFPIAFVISWSLVIFLYRRINREVKALDAKIKQARAEHESSTPQATS